MGTTKPVPDALMWRDVSDHVWDVKWVPMHRVNVFLEGGWHIPISEPEIRAMDITDTYNADLTRWNLKERR